MNGLFEILSNKEWMISQEFLHSILPTLQYNIANHASLGIEREKKSPMAIGQQGQDLIREYQVTEDGTVLPDYDPWEGGDILGRMKEPFVNVMPVDGPITRNGGACSYGSRDIRDWMMHAADNKFCQGHILHINTPGGSAWAKNDFQQGIDYAHERGQRVIAFIDGLCASAGMYLAALCDEVYVMNLKDQLGCVGVMAAFFTMKSGEKDPCTGETYREYYDPESVDKNKEIRDIAEDEDATLLIDELRELGEEFRADMKASFPNADIDEHLKGKIFDAKDVMGILCDGQMMLGEVVSRVFNLANGSEQPIERTAGRTIDQAAETCVETTMHSVATTASEKKNVSPKNSTTMTDKKYQKITQLLGVDELVVTEGGTFLNVALLDSLEEKLEKMTAQDENKEPAQEPAPEPTAEPAEEEQKPADGEKPTEEEKPAEEEEKPTEEEEPAEEEKPTEEEEKPTEEEKPADTEQPSEESLQNAQEDIDKMTETLHNAEQMIAGKDKEIAESAKEVESLTEQLDAAKAELETARGGITEKDATIEAKDKVIDESAKIIAEKQAEIDKLTKQVTDLKAEVKELAGNPAPMIDAGAGIPENNGTGDAPKQKGSRIKRGMSYQQIRERMKDDD